jgi:hypothetical protein
VVGIYRQVLQSGGLTPFCRAPFFKTTNEQLLEDALTPGNAFSFFHGQEATYTGGNFTILSTSSVEAMMKDIDSITGSFAAQMYTSFILSPSLETLFVMQHLLEDSTSGAVIPASKNFVIHLGPPVVMNNIFYVIIVVLSVIVLLMEIRRIVAWPKRWTFEEKPDKFGAGTICFIVMPLGFLCDYIFWILRSQQDVDETLVQLSSTNTTQIDEAIQTIYALFTFDYFSQLIALVNLFLLNVALFRYLLMFFPGFSYYSAMLRKLIKPLLVTLFFLACAFMVFGLWLYLLYGHSKESFRSAVATTLTMTMYATGRIRGWSDLFQEQPISWIILISLSYFTFQLVLNNLAVAIMFSHLKEKDLRENYSYNTFWTDQLTKHRAPVKGDTKQGAKNKEVTFNPAQQPPLVDDKDRPRR